MIAKNLLLLTARIDINKNEVRTINNRIKLLKEKAQEMLTSVLNKEFRKERLAFYFENRSTDGVVWLEGYYEVTVGHTKKFLVKISYNKYNEIDVDFIINKRMLNSSFYSTGIFPGNNRWNLDEFYEFKDRYLTRVKNILFSNYDDLTLDPEI